MERLMSICGGWSSCGTMIVSPDPQGGIIDRNMAGLGWFVIFNDDRAPSDQYFDSLEDAIEFFCNVEVV